MKQKEILEVLRGGEAVAYAEDVGLYVRQEHAKAAADEIERLQKLVDRWMPPTTVSSAKA